MNTILGAPFSSLKHVVSIRHMSRGMIIQVIDVAIHLLLYVLRKQYVSGPDGFNLQPGQVGPGAINLMYQASTGTKISLDTAANLMQCNQATSVENLQATSRKKGERLRHTIKRFRNQAMMNFFALRSHFMGLVLALALEADRNQSARSMLKYDVTFINAGEGNSYHPTQILLDLLTWVIWKLFHKAIDADGGSLLYFRNLEKAVEKFCSYKKSHRHKRIGDIIDSLTICFGGDLDSRIFFDYLSLSREIGGQRKFGIKFILAAPEWAMPDDLYLQGVNHTTTADFHPDLPADIFYRLRFRFEDRPQEMHDMIKRTAKQFQVDVPFLERCRTRVRDGVSEAFVFEALPIDKNYPSIAEEAEDHPNLLCWLQAWCALPARMAVYKCGYDCWSTEEAVAQSRWLVPQNQSADLIPVRNPISLSGYIEKWNQDHSKADDHVRMFGVSGCMLDHIPQDQSSFIKRFLRSNGYPGKIITSDRVIPRKGGEPKDMLWFPEIKLYQWNPQVLTALDFLTSRSLTYNEFDVAEDSFKKFKVNPVGRVVGLLTCPSGVNEILQDGAVCITGHQEEVPTVSINDLSGTEFPRAECLYCGRMHTSEEMCNSLKKALPTA